MESVSALAWSCATPTRQGFRDPHGQALSSDRQRTSTSQLFTTLPSSLTSPYPTDSASSRTPMVYQGASPSRRLITDTFIGRERELDELRAGFEAASSGCGRVVLLAGEAGIGKTRTAHELAAYAHLQGAQALIGRCYEGRGAPPFWPWVQIVRSYIRNHDTPTLQAAMGTGAADIAQVIAEVRERLPDLPPPPGLEPEQARFRFFDSLTNFFKHVGKACPLVLILDDLHWADKPSLLLLQFLARELWEAHVLVIATYRDEEAGHCASLSETLAELSREQGSQRILLQGLTKPDVARFIEISAATKPSEALVTTVYQKTEGNPFFLNEIVRLLITDGLLQDALQGGAPAFTLPQSVRDVIGRRLSALSPECNCMLTIAAVVGREFTIDTLERVTGTTAEQIVEVLEEARTAHVVTEVPRMVGRYSFVHALIRDTLYEELPTIRRVHLHGRIGETLEGLYKEQPEPAFSASSGQTLSELAYHFFEAALGGGAGSKAVEYATQAGKRATALLAYEEAVCQYERALHILDRDCHTAHNIQRCELLLALGEALEKSAEIPRAREIFQQAAHLSRHLGAPEHFANAALGFGAAVLPGVVNQPLIALLEEALRVLGEENSALRARVLGRLAMVLPISTERERRALLSQQAVTMARRVGDPATLAYALSTRHWAMWGPENTEDRLAVATEVVRLAEEAADKSMALVGHFWRLTDLLELGDLAAVELETEACAQLAEELRRPYWLWGMAQVRAMRALLEGQFEEAEQLAQYAFTLGQRVRDRNAFQYFGVQMFALRREQGRLQELEAVVKGFVEQYPTLPSWRCGLAYLYSELGRTTETQAEFAHLAANDFADLPRDQNWLICMVFLSQVCAVLGDAPHAARLYELLLPYAQRNVVVGIAAVSNGSASRSLGLLAATMARWDDAAQHFADALEMNERMGAKPWVAHTQYEYAHMLVTRNQPGDRQQARELLGQALHTAQELGMKSLGEKLEALQEQGIRQVNATQDQPRHEHIGASKQVPNPRSRVPTGEENIFRREGDYWTLVYRGMTCRLKDMKGLSYIALLLRHPQREFVATELITSVGRRQGISAAAGYSTISAEQLAACDLHVGSGLGDAGELLDAQAKAAYKRRLDELQEELEEAQRFHDLARAAKAQAEIDFLAEELTASVGLNGRSRKAASAVERARLNVTKSIKAAVKKISQTHSALGHHLNTSIKTGTFCSYTPDPTLPLVWVL